MPIKALVAALSLLVFSTLSPGLISAEEDINVGTTVSEVNSSEMRQKKQEVKENIKEKAQEISAEVRQKKIEVIKEVLTKIVRRLTSAGERLDKISERIQARLDKFEQRGANVAAAQASLD